MKNVFSSVIPLYTIIKAFGLFPLSFDGSIEDGKFISKWRDFVVPICSVIIALSIIFLNIIVPVYITGFSRLITIIFHLHGVIGSGMIFALFFYQISKHRRIVHFLESLHNFDLKVRLDVNISV